MDAFSSGPANDRPAAGITAIVLGLFLFSLQDVVIKSFSDRYSVLQIVFIRGVVALIPMVIAVLATTGWRGLFPLKPGLMLLKGMFGFLSYCTYYLAIAALPLAAVVAIVFTAPIFVTVLSALLLGETVGRRRWLAVAVGFLGVVVVIGPSGHVWNAAAFLALVSALFYASSTITTRFIGSVAEPWTISLYSMLVFVTGSGLASVIIAGGTFAGHEHASLQFLLRPWVIPATRDLLLMILLGFNAAVGFYCITKAYWIAPVSVVAPFEYTYIIWAVLFGYVFWSEVPRPTTALGVVILIASSLYILRRELAESRARIRVSEPAPPPVTLPAPQARGPG